MDTALPQKFPFILDRNLAKANCTANRVCTSCDTVVLVLNTSKLMNFSQTLFLIHKGPNYVCYTEPQRCSLLVVLFPFLSSQDFRPIWLHDPQSHSYHRSSFCSISEDFCIYLPSFHANQLHLLESTTEITLNFSSNAIFPCKLYYMNWFINVFLYAYIIK